MRIGQGAHLLGFDPETETWESVTAVPPKGVGKPAGMVPAMEELLTWIRDRHERRPSSRTTGRAYGSTSVTRARN